MNQKPVKNEGRQPTDTITKEHLEEFIATQDDFALELYAYTLARKLGFNPTHAGSYVDPQTGKARQFDVQASRACGENFHIYFAIECKALRPSFPLLVSQIPRIRAESFIHIVRSVGKGKNGKMALAAHAHNLTDGASLYGMSEFVGKALSQVGFNGEGKLHSRDSEVFDKWGQAIASSSQLINRAASLNYVAENPWQNSAVLPILVVPDGTLWTVNYHGSDEHDEPVQTHEAQYFIGSTQTIDASPPAKFMLSHLHIVTKTGLERLLQRFVKGGQDAEHLMGMLY